MRSLCCSFIEVRFGCLVPPQRKQAPIAPAHAGLALHRARRIAEYRRHAGYMGALPHGGLRGVRGKTAEELTVTSAVIVHAARRIECDRRERPHERPAQAKAVA